MDHPKLDRPLRLATRGSDLARTQSQHVADAITAATGVAVELVIVRTRGDAITDRPLAEIGGKGLFTKEIEEALLDGRADLAVHSLKDLPTESPAGLTLGAIPAREDARDAIVGARLADLRHGAVVGTGSGRRALQLKVLRPDLDVRGVRGNVETRVRKQREGEYDAVVLAAAGLRRLRRDGDITEVLEVGVMVPAPGQGALGVQVREDDPVVAALVASIHDAETALTTSAERAFLAAVQGGCSVPAACHAWRDGARLRLRAFFSREEGVWVSESGFCDPADAARAGAELGRHVRSRMQSQPPRAR